MTHLPICSILNAAVKVTSSRNAGWSRWLIFWLWHRSQKQKAPFPQGSTTVDHQNPTPNHSQNVTKAQEVNLVTHLVMSPGTAGSFNVNFLFIYYSSTWPISQMNHQHQHIFRCFSITKIGKSERAIFISPKSTLRVMMWWIWFHGHFTEHFMGIELISIGERTFFLKFISVESW